MRWAPDRRDLRVQRWEQELLRNYHGLQWFAAEALRRLGVSAENEPQNAVSVYVNSANDRQKDRQK